MRRDAMRRVAPQGEGFYLAGLIPDTRRIAGSVTFGGSNALACAST